MDAFKLSEDGKTLIKYEGQDIVVEVPEGVEIIGGNAFNGCDSIVSVSLPSTLKKISYKAFCDCESLSDILFEKEIECSGCSFCSCPKLKSSIIIGNKLIRVPESYEGKYDFPSTITSISKGAFCGCKKVKELIIPEGVEKIYWGAICNCDSLVTIEIPSSVVELEPSSFSCKNIKRISVNKNNQVYDSRDNCNAIIETSSNTIILGCCNTQIPNSVTTIASNAFSYITQLNEITIPHSVTKIDELAFTDCDNLSKIIFEEGTKYLSFAGFFNCSNIREIIIPNSAIPFMLKNKKVENANDINYLREEYVSSEIRKNLDNPIYNERYFWGLPTKYKGEYNVPDGITHIDTFAFAECADVERVNLPQSIIAIGEDAFTGCKNLKCININDNIIIENAVFDDCISLQHHIVVGRKLIRVPPNANDFIVEDSISSIESAAFQKCINITSVFIPNGVEINGSRVFEDCVNLRSVSLPNNIKIIKRCLFSGCKNLTHINLPNNVISIEDNAFRDCENIKSIVIPKTVEEIGDSAFENCKALELIMFEDGSCLTKLGHSAFKDCVSLKDIDIPNGIKRIEKESFANCISLETITIPTSVETIVSSAFSGSSNIQRAYMSTSWNHAREALGLPAPAILGFPLFENDIDESDTLLGDGEMLYTNGRFRPCPYCGHEGTSTYTDGTAQCDKCRGWFRYAYPKIRKIVPAIAFKSTSPNSHGRKQRPVRDFPPKTYWPPFPPACDWAAGCVCPRRVGDYPYSANRSI